MTVHSRECLVSIRGRGPCDCRPSGRAYRQPMPVPVEPMKGRTPVREPLPHVRRAGIVGDLAWVVETWVRTDKGWHGRKRAREATHDVRELLCLPGTVLLVAADPADLDALYAWACFEGDRLHWAYTREPLRRMGLQRSLLGDMVERFKERAE